MNTPHKPSTNDKDNISHRDEQHMDKFERLAGHEADVSNAPRPSIRRNRPADTKKVIGRGKLSQPQLQGLKANEKERIKQLRSELERLEKLPGQSAFAKHRRKIVSKALDLIKIAKDKRTAEESESLAQLIGKIKF